MKLFPFFAVLILLTLLVRRSVLVTLLHPSWASENRSFFDADHHILRSAWLHLGLCLIFPWTVPADERVLRIVATGYAIIFSLHCWEFHRGRIADPGLLRKPLGFLFCWFIPLDARRPNSEAQYQDNRKKARLRLGRAIAKFGLLGLAFAINLGVDRQWPSPWLMSAWSMVGLYAYFSGLADLLTGTGMLTGIDIEEPFDNPWISRSPSDFWGRRWNRFVNNFTRRQVFWPMGGLRRPIRATLTVFICSGIAHEYVVFCCRPGLSPYFGYTLAFFTLHGLTVLVQPQINLWTRTWHRKASTQRAARLPLPLAISMHTLWMWATSPLFFLPLQDALGYLEWF